MTDLLGTLAEANRVLAKLNPRAFQDRCEEWTRAGLPSASLGSGSRAAEPPLPNFEDPTDVEMARFMRAAQKLAQHALNDLLELQRLERILIPPRKEDDEDAYKAWRQAMVDKLRDLRGPRAIECANDSCKVITNTPKSGRCQACYVYRKANGKDASAEVVAKRTERDLESLTS